MLCLSSASQLGGVSFIKDECVFGKNEMGNHNYVTRELSLTPLSSTSFLKLP